MFVEVFVLALDLTVLFCHLYCTVELLQTFCYLLINVQRVTQYYSSLLVRKLYTGNQSYGIGELWLGSLDGEGLVSVSGGSV